MIVSHNSIKTTLSDHYDGSYQRHVCTNFQKICFYWTYDNTYSVTKHFLAPTPPFIDFKNFDILTQFSKNNPIRRLYWPFSEINMDPFPEKMFLLSLGQDHFRNKKILVPTPQYIDFKNVNIFSQFNKSNTIRNLWRFFSETHMHRLPENMFLLILRQYHFSKKKFFIATFPFIDFKSSDIFIQFNKNDPIRHLWWLFSKTCLNRLSEIMFLLSLDQDNFSNKKFVSS